MIPQSCISSSLFLQWRCEGIPCNNQASCFSCKKTLSSLELPRVSVASLPTTSFSVNEPHPIKSQESLDENTYGPYLVPNENAAESPEKSSHDLEKVSKADPVPADPLEFEKLMLTRGKPRKPLLAHEEWITFMDSEGRVMDPKDLKKRIFYGGVSQELRKEVWPFLLGYYEYDSTSAEREYLRSIKKQEFETIKQQWQSISTQQAKRFTKFRERKGHIEKDVL